MQRLVFFGPVAYFGPSWQRFARMVGLGNRALQLTLDSAQRSLGIRFEEAEPARVAPGMSIPLTVFHDRGDKETPFTDGEEVARRWPGAVLVPTEQLGHMRILKDPDVVARAVDFAAGAHAANDARDREATPNP